MNLINIERLPEKTKKTLSSYIGKLIDIYGDDVLSVFAYGSIACNDFNIAKSDINMAVVFREVDVDRLKRSAKAVRRGLKQRVNVPLFVTEEYINSSLDTFPLEFLNMKISSILLYGKDLLNDITFKNEDIRRECEYQIKGRIITLRQAYLEQALSPRRLEELLKKALKSIFPVFSGLLFLKKGERLISKEEILCEIREEYAIDVTPFMEVYRDKKCEGKIGGKSAEIFIDSFLMELNKLSKVVDRLKT